MYTYEQRIRAVKLRRGSLHEFLHKHQKAKGVTLYKWAKSLPELAHPFARLKKAEAIAAEKEGAEIVILFETQRQYVLFTDAPK